jgi:hypothetical protein
MVYKRLFEADKTSQGTSASPAATQKITSTLDDTKKSVSKQQEAGSYQINNVHDVYSILPQAMPQVFKLVDQHLKIQNQNTIGSSGYALFGVTPYSPVRDILRPALLFSPDITSLLDDKIDAAIQEYKAFGHAIAMFVDDDGNTARYEFAFSGDCPKIDRNQLIKTMDEKIKSNPALGVAIYDQVIDILSTAAGTLQGGSVGLAGGFASAAAGAAAGGALASKVSSIATKFVDSKSKADLVRKLLPYLLKNYSDRFSELIHFNIPGKVYSGAYITSKLLTSRKLVEFFRQLSPAMKSKGFVYEEKNDSKYFYIKISHPSPQYAGFSRNFKIKNTVLSAIDLCYPRIESQAPTPSYLEDAESRVDALLVFPSTNLVPGVTWCNQINDTQCSVPYTLPIPATEIFIPDITGALNCGLFAANAVNRAISDFKFDLSNRTDVFTSPVSLFEQGKSTALDVFVSDMSGYKF